MKREIASFVCRLRRDESGAVGMLVAMMIIALIGFAALAIDIGNLAYTKQMLQSTTDLAAEAGAATIYGPNSARTAAIAYSAQSGDNNVQPGPVVTIPSGYPKLVALNGTSAGGCPTGAQLINYPACIETGPNSTSSGGCTNTGGCNAIVVEQQVSVPPILGGIFGMGQVTLTATSLALGKGGALPPLNIMMIIDNSDSMSNTHESGATCGGISNPTKIQCALSGVQTLLSELWPTQDQVGIMVFPGLANNTSVTNDVGCTTSKTTCNTPSNCSIAVTGYNNSPIYQIVTPTNSGGGSTNNYCSVSQGSCGTSTALSTSSPVVSASCQTGMLLGQSTTHSCGSCAGEQVQGGEGTYFADAITQAQTTLVATNQTGVCANLNCQNVIILLSDGGAGNAGDTESSTATTNNEALPGTATLTFASLPSSAVAGTTVADNTTASAIPAGTTIVSATATTVTLSAAVTAAAAGTTNAATPPGGTILHFASVPPGVARSMLVSDQTDTSAITACTTVTSFTATTVTLSNPVVGTTAATDVASAATPIGGTTLYFASVPATLQVGMGVADTTDSSAIPSGTTVTSFTATTVTLSNPVGLTVHDTTSGQTKKGTTTLHFTSAPQGVAKGFAISGTGIATGTTVQSVNGTTITISQGTTAAFNGGTTITFTGDNVAIGDTITFSKDVGVGDTITFGGVGCSDQIAFGAANQCNLAITAAHNAANAGTWVYSIAYGSGLGDTMVVGGRQVIDPDTVANNSDFSSCSDNESPQVNSCYTMQQIASSPGAIPDPSKFYSDPMAGGATPNPSLYCVSPANPNATSVASIFSAIGTNLTHTVVVGCGTTAAGGSC